MISGSGGLTPNFYSGDPDRNDWEGRATQRAVQLFWRVHNEAWINSIWCRLLRRAYCLRDLHCVAAAGQIAGGYYAGLQIVPIASIRGSEGRMKDFDLAFRPLEEHCRSRWLRIATLRLLGHSLPPVDLVEVDGEYFVRDGHHRISVARVLGEEVMDAAIIHLAPAATKP